jgi:hypothetical protein
MEDRLLNSPVSRNRLSQLSMADVADRHLRDKTDAIAYIIRNISEQCAAAVEGLELARSADNDDDESTSGHEDNRSGSKSPAGTVRHNPNKKHSSMHRDHHHHGHREHHHGRQQSSASQAGGAGSSAASSAGGSEFGDDAASQASVYLNPDRNSSVPPTPDLVHRSGTSMSMTSASTTPERHSLQHYPKDDGAHAAAEGRGVPTRVVEGDEDVEVAHMEEPTKYGSEVRRNPGTRVTLINRV